MTDSRLLELRAIRSSIDAGMFAFARLLITDYVDHALHQLKGTRA